MFKVIISILLFILMVPLSMAAQEATPFDLLGYIVRPTENALQLETLTNGTRSPLPTVHIENAVWQYLAIAPNEQLLAFTALSPTGEFSLEVHDLRQGTVDRQPLPATSDNEVGFRLDWSPDSTRLVISPPNLLEAPILYDAVNQLLVPFETDYARAIQWLDNGQLMLFHGLPVCGNPCAAFDDLYLAEYSDQSISISPVTRVDADELEIRERMTSKYISLGLPMYHPLEKRIYANLSEGEVNPGGFELLYSTDLEGNLRFEADIAAIDPESQFPAQIQRIIYSPADHNLYLVVYTDGIGSDFTIGRFTVLRMIPCQGLSRIYDFDFNRLDQTTYFTTSIKLSPDGQYLALGLSGSATARKGKLVVLDLLQSAVVTDEATPQQVCELFWSDDSTRVIYTQTDETACVRFYDNQPVNRLVEYNVLTKSTQVLVEDAKTAFYFLSGQ